VKIELEETMRKLLLLIPLVLLLTHCTLGAPAQPTPDVAAIVNATLSAADSGQGAAPQAASAGTGSVSGQLNYPADAIPALRVVAFLVGSDQYFSVDTAAGQNTYQIGNLVEGKYHVVAYTLGGSGFPAGSSGAYTQAVLCGMGQECTDHGLIDVIVYNGETTTDVNVFDWLQSDFPPMPGGVPASGGAPATGGVGAISGQLMFPSGAIPVMKVVAFNIETGETFAVDTAANQNTYQIDNLPSGRYFVVAYSMGADGNTPGVVGGYTAAVPCGLSAACTDHTLLEVSVIANSMTQNVAPGDFYAPEGTFPAMP
jgi:hypothetical protein